MPFQRFPEVSLTSESVAATAETDARRGARGAPRTGTGAQLGCSTQMRSRLRSSAGEASERRCARSEHRGEREALLGQELIWRSTWVQYTDALAGSARRRGGARRRSGARRHSGARKLQPSNAMTAGQSASETPRAHSHPWQRALP